MLSSVYYIEEHPKWKTSMFWMVDSPMSNFQVLVSAVYVVLQIIATSSDNIEYNVNDPKLGWIQ